MKEASLLTEEDDIILLSETKFANGKPPASISNTDLTTYYMQHAITESEVVLVRIRESMHGGGESQSGVPRNKLAYALMGDPWAARLMLMVWAMRGARPMSDARVGELRFHQL